jgi:hypothetical protein
VQHLEQQKSRLPASPSASLSGGALAKARHRTSAPFPGDALRLERGVISGLTSVIKSFHFQIHWERVKGHQDAVVPHNQLTRMERLKVIATDGLDIAEPQRTRHFITPSKAELQVNSTTVTSHCATHLQRAAASKDFFKWCSGNCNWSTTEINFVDWDAHLAAIQKTTFSEK